jgi:hypothetical protein
MTRAHEWIVECAGCGRGAVLRHVPSGSSWWCSGECYREARLRLVAAGQKALPGWVA